MLAYPVVADYLSQSSANSVISSYIEASTNESVMSSVTELKQQAYAYNDRLAESSNASSGVTNSVGSVPDSAIKPYNEQLSLSTNSTGCIAWVEIPKLSEQLPVYHGTSSDTLENGIGHLEGSSLPVGGSSTHSVLTAHSGMPGSRMFDDIGSLNDGDEILVHVLDQTLTYKVMYSETVLPDQLDSLCIQSGKDLVTLVTCTPYGVNTHRLLVHAERDDSAAIPSEIPGVLGNSIINARTIPFLSAILAVTMFFIGFITVKRVKYGKIKQTRNNTGAAGNHADKKAETRIVTRELVNIDSRKNPERSRRNDAVIRLEKPKKSRHNKNN